MDKKHTETVRNFNIAWPMFAVIGGLASLQGWFAPIHEFGHILASVLQGGGGYFTSWYTVDLTNVLPAFFWFVDIGGFLFEQVVFFSIAVIAARKGHYYLTAFAATHYLVTSIIAPVVSSDFDGLHDAWLIIFWLACFYGALRMAVVLLRRVTTARQTAPSPT